MGIFVADEEDEEGEEDEEKGESIFGFICMNADQTE
jgi:hypothetical protein